MNQYMNRQFPTTARTIASQMLLGLFCLSSPLFVTTASWAQQASEIPETNSPNVKVSVPLGNSSQPSVKFSPNNVPPAIPVLIQVLQGKQAPAGFDASSAIPILIQGLQGNNPDIRELALSAAPGIVQALQNNQQQVEAQTQTQVQQEPQTQTQVQEEPQSQPRVQSASRCVVKNPASIVPGLVQALSNQDGLVRLFAASTLGCIGEQATDAVPALLSSLQDPNQSVRLVAAFALDAIGSGFQQTARHLSSGELDQLISGFDSALKVVSDPLLKLPQQAVNSLLNPLQILQQERQVQEQQE